MLLAWSHAVLSIVHVHACYSLHVHACCHVQPLAGVACLNSQQLRTFVTICNIT